MWSQIVAHGERALAGLGKIMKSNRLLLKEILKYTKYYSQDSLNNRSTTPRIACIAVSSDCFRDNHAPRLMAMRFI